MYVGDIWYSASITLSVNLFRTYIIYRFMQPFFGKESDNQKKEWLCYLLFYVATSGGHLLFHSKNINIVTNLATLLLITGCYETRWQRRVLVTLLVYGCNIGADFLSLHLFTNYYVTKTVDDAVGYSTMMILLIEELLFEKFWTKNKDKKNMPYKHILAIVLVISMALIYFAEYGIQSRRLLVLTALSILLIEFLIFYLYDVLTGMYNKLEMQSQLEKQVLQYANQLEVMTRSEEKVTAFRHDMRNHLAELSVMAKKCKNEEIETYIQRMGVSIESQKEFVRTGNLDMDSLMNYFLGRATKELEHVEYEITVPSGISMSAFDLNVILGNLMENAIEAACHSEKKWLFVQISYERGALFIEVRNSFSHELKKEKDSYCSTKKEGNHGIGLRNVKRMIEYYNGMFETSNDKIIFTAKAMLYIK